MAPSRSTTEERFPSASPRSAGPWHRPARNDRPWLLFLASPFLLGAVVKVFPLDRLFAGALLASALALIVVTAVLSRLGRQPRVAWLGGALLLAVILGLPFVAMRDGTRTSGAVRPAYSFHDAKADPAAFEKWWNFFVDEVVRTNAIVLERDPRGTPFQGVLPYRPKPGAKADFHRGSISINSLGYRGDEFGRTKRADVYRILAVGDSVTFGQTLFPDSRPWPARLEQIISRELQCNKRIEVVNGAVNGFRLRNAIDRIEHDHAWLKPDLVLSYFGWNTMVDLGIDPNGSPPLSAPDPRRKTEFAIWHLKSAASSLMTGITSHFAGAIDDILRGSSAPRSADTQALLASTRESALRSDYVMLVNQSHRLSYRLVLLSFNTAATTTSPEEVKSFYGSVTHAFRSILRQVEIHNLLLREIASDTGTLLVDTSEDLHGRFDEDLYIDAVHFTAKGDGRLARNAFRGIRAMLLTDPSLGCRPQ